MPLKSLESMRAGSVLSPHGLAQRYLRAARSAGQPKEWALRFRVWVDREINSLWPMESTPLQALEARAMALEGIDNAAEKAHDLKQCVESLRHRFHTQMAELAIDELVAAKLQRKLEDMERGPQ